MDVNEEGREREESDACSFATGMCITEYTRGAIPRYKAGNGRLSAINKPLVHTSSVMYILTR